MTGRACQRGRAHYCAEKTRPTRTPAAIPACACFHVPAWFNTSRPPLLVAFPSAAHALPPPLPPAHLCHQQAARHAGAVANDGGHLGIRQVARRVQPMQLRQEVLGKHLRACVEGACQDGEKPCVMS